VRTNTATTPATRVVVPRQVVTKPVSQTEHRLPHRHFGEHVVEQVGGGSAIRRPPQLEDTARALSEKGTIGRGHSRPSETARTRPASQPHCAEVPELVLNEPRQACSIAQTRGLQAEGLEVIVHRHEALAALLARRRGLPGATRSRRRAQGSDVGVACHRANARSRNGLVIQQDAAYLPFRALGAPKAAGSFAQEASARFASSVYGSPIRTQPSAARAASSRIIKRVACCAVSCLPD
jgi:hypothetical protein